MSLFTATLLTGTLLLVLGAAFLFGGEAFRARAFGLLRSKQAAWVLFGGASVWFLWHILNLGEADFGNYRNWLFLLFGAVALGSFIVVPDFLPVRGIAVLILLSARPLLDAAYMQFDHPQRLFLVTFVYAAILLALYLGTVPYRLRDFFTWLWASPRRVKVLGALTLAYGLLLSGVAFSY